MPYEIDRDRLRRVTAQETERFVATHPRAREAYARAQRTLLGGVPMSWMHYWRAPFPIVVAEAQGARVVDIDGHIYTDYCLGEGAALFGHAPAGVVRAMAGQVARGLSHLLPTEDAARVGELLAERFGLAQWQFALSATDANRFVVRMLRVLTGRPVVVVFNGCYHGTVDELTDAEQHAVADALPQGSHPRSAVRSIEFNDIDALEAALAPGDVACVLSEPALTNVGTILPDAGFHAALRAMTRAAGTYLVLDETHTLAAGPRGCTGVWQLEPDVITVGKAIGSGVPAAAYGFSAALAARLEAADLLMLDGIGGTLAGCALSVAAMRATLEEVATGEAYGRSTALAERFIGGVQQVIDDWHLPWHTLQLGCRAEYAFSPTPARNLAHAAALGTTDRELTSFLRLHAMNRGVLLVPFVSNVALLSPDLQPADVDRHTELLADALRLLTG